MPLTPQQETAVYDRGGSLLVSAAAGSGKTKVLVERLFSYMEQEGCQVDDFLIITYTKAAAAELRGKIAQELTRRVRTGPGTATCGGRCCGCIRRTSKPWTPSAPDCSARTCTCCPRWRSTA